MYVIATVFCSNFHFSVSLHVPFSQFLFERDSYSNEYLVLTCKFWRRYSRERASLTLEEMNKLIFIQSTAFSARGFGSEPHRQDARRGARKEWNQWIE